MNYHFIAIGGAVMHNLAIALQQKGHTITGSDDEIFDPALSRLKAAGICPECFGWFPEKIHPQLDAVIVGMHARANNPELTRAIEMGVKVFSFPEFLYEHAKHKKRIVIGGSHGKTTITAMIMHVMRHLGMDFGYLVGAQVRGFDVMVRISDSTPFMVFEGDEYLAAPFDPRPKFHLYHPHVALISGIAWDHINVFPDFDDYVKQFWEFAGMIEPGGSLVYNQEDELVRNIAVNISGPVIRIPYNTPDYFIEDGNTFLRHNGKSYPLRIFGKHNLQNLAGAWKICRECEIADEDFLSAIISYEGAARRLEKIGSNLNTNIYRDFAHSPSKLKATVSAVKEQYPGQWLVACMELHTFSSLSAGFLNQYHDCMKDADEAIVYFNPHTIIMKKLPPISKLDIYEAFSKEGLHVFTDSDEMFNVLVSKDWKGKNLLLMSSGNFNGVDLAALTAKILQ